MSAGQGMLLVGVVVLALVTIVVTVTLLRRRERVWRRFAARHGLGYSRRGEVDKPAVHGTVRGRPFELVASRSSSDTGLFGVEQVRMSLGLAGTLPPGLVVGLRIAPGANVRYEARATDEASLAAWLTAARQRALDELFDSTLLGGIEDGRLWIAERQATTSLERLEERLGFLERLAAALEQG